MIALHPKVVKDLLTISARGIRLHQTSGTIHPIFHLIIRNILLKINNLQIISKIAEKLEASYINNFVKTTDQNSQEYLTHKNTTLMEPFAY